MVTSSVGPGSPGRSRSLTSDRRCGLGCCWWPLPLLLPAFRGLLGAEASGEARRLLVLHWIRRACTPLPAESASLAAPAGDAVPLVLLSSGQLALVVGGRVASASARAT